MLIITVINIYAGREIRTPEVRDHRISNPTPYQAGPSPLGNTDINRIDKKLMSKQMFKYPVILWCFHGGLDREIPAETPA